MANNRLTVTISATVKRIWALKAGLLFLRIAAWFINLPSIWVRIGKGKTQRLKSLFRLNVEIEEVKPNA